MYSKLKHKLHRHQSQRLLQLPQLFRHLRQKLLRQSRLQKQRATRFLKNRFTKKRAGPASVSDNIRLFANAGAEFETADPLDGSTLKSRAKAVAFYLPQFHAFDENDRWWGEGFTEWRNVARGAPRFAGHYQPRIPRDLGHYDLSSPDTILKQSQLAVRNGIDAFCFYYYWFNGQRLMDKPLDHFAEADIDQEFCIMWANENWTRTWDGMDSDVLIKQDYRLEDEQAFIEDTARYMKHPRYLRVDNRPLFILYRPGLLPEAKETLSRWREQWHSVLGVEPLIFMVQGFGATSPEEFGLDGAIEFPPHKLCAHLRNINHELNIIDNNFRGLVHDYDDVIDRSLNESAPDYPLIKTVVPHWDNDARREGRGTTLHGSTPQAYSRWLNGAIAFANTHPVLEESLVFINAWNEWAEGAYLEPDVHYGHAYLNATRRAVKGLANPADNAQILLVGHDAHRHGAQMLLMNMAQLYKQQFGLQVNILLKEGGPLLEEYRQLAPTYVVSDVAKNGLGRFLRTRNITAAICNTIVTGDLVPQLRQQGVQVVSLIHEMPQLIEQYNLQDNVKKIARHANHVVFPADIVRNGFVKIAQQVKAQQQIRPQGSYFSVEKSAEKRNTIRRALGIGDTDQVVLGVGYADLRKGFDLFMQQARDITCLNHTVHFIWAGAIDATLDSWMTRLTEAEAQNIHLPGFCTDVADYYSAADCLYLPSREDPYPTVVLEAMGIGLPVVLYRGTTGFDELITEHGYLADIGDSSSTQRLLLQALSESNELVQQRRISHVKENSRFDDYCFDMLKLARPELKKHSVVVVEAGVNNEHVMQQMASVFVQTDPVFEIVLLVEQDEEQRWLECQQLAMQSGRKIEIRCQSENNADLELAAKAVSRGDQLTVIALSSNNSLDDDEPITRVA